MIRIDKGSTFRHRDRSGSQELFGPCFVRFKAGAVLVGAEDWDVEAAQHIAQASCERILGTDDREPDVVFLAKLLKAK